MQTDFDEEMEGFLLEWSASFHEKRGKGNEHGSKGEWTKGGSMVDIKKGRETHGLRIYANIGVLIGDDKQSNYTKRAGSLGAANR